MRIAGLLTLAIFLPASVQAAVVINEVAWMGTAASANAEWMELYNSGSTPVDLTSWRIVAESGSPSITLAGSIAANGYFLLERTSDASVPAVTADHLYTGALTNTGTTLTLTNAEGAVIDQVAGGANWADIGGNNASKETAQRTASGWTTAAATPRAINVGVSSPPPNSDPVEDSSTATTTEAVPAPSSSSGPTEYLPIPVLRIVTSGDRTVSSGADTAFTAAVYDGKGNTRGDATVTWSFGDGVRKTGASVFHSYYEPGEYVAVVHAITTDGGDAFAEDVITAKEASIRISSVSARGISLTNGGTRTLNLSLWRLSAGGKEFRIPEDTQVLAGRTVLFPSPVTQLPPSDSAVFLYPNGEVAAAYPATAAVPKAAASPQPSAGAVSYKNISEVEPISGARMNVPAYAEAVDAPGAATELAAPGAAPYLASDSDSRIAGIFKSPWTLGFLAVVALAGGAFIFL